MYVVNCMYVVKKQYFPWLYLLLRAIQSDPYKQH